VLLGNLFFRQPQEKKRKKKKKKGNLPEQQRFFSCSPHGPACDLELAVAVVYSRALTLNSLGNG
jgi:hypothetical protein